MRGRRKRETYVEDEDPRGPLVARISNIRNHVRKKIPESK
jgi:hypothetical protein